MIVKFMHHNPLMMNELELDQESDSNLRLRGGHDLPAFNAARFISRIATICRACDLLSSRRLTLPPRRPILARYSRTFLSVSVIVCPNGRRSACPTVQWLQPAS